MKANIIKSVLVLSSVLALGACASAGADTSTTTTSGDAVYSKAQNK